MKIKKILAGTLAAVFMTVGLPQIVSAAGDIGDYVSERYGDFWYRVLSDGTVCITGYSGEDENMVIPDTIDDMAVTTIDEEAFFKVSHIVTVEIPDSVINIRSLAFWNCSSLTNMVIPDSVASIGYNVFLGCTSLLSIDVDENNTNYASVDGILFDKNVTTLLKYPAGKQNTEYTVPDSVTTIDFTAFYDCTSLESLTIPASVTDISEPQKGVGGLNSENLTIYGYAGSAAEAFAEKKGINFVALDEEPADSNTPSKEDTPLEDKDTGIKATAADGVIPEGAVLKVEADEENSDESSVAFDITISTADGKPAAINGTVTVTVPVPDELKGADTYYVFYKADDGTLTDMKATCKDGVITFTTTHFSTYIVSTVNLLADKNTPNSGIEGVAVIAGLAIAAAGAILLTKKRK